MQRTYTNVLCRGNKILYRGYDVNNERIHEAINHKPTLFTESKKDSEWKSLDGKSLQPVVFDCINDCRDFLKDYSDVSGVTLYGNDNYIYNYLETQDSCHPRLEDLNVAYIDIETECENGFPSVDQADQKVNAITIKTKFDGKYDAFTFCTEEAKPVNERHFVSVHMSEKSLFYDFIKWWNEKDFDIITGWNINFFDIPYLVHRINNIMGPDAASDLSPWKYIKSRKVVIMNKENITYELCGISTLDYYDLYKKFTFVNRETYKLDHIGFVELGEKKASFDGFDTIQDLYKKDFSKFIEYNHQDVLLVEKLENKLKLLQLAVDLAYSSKVNFSDVFSQVRMWDCIIYYHLYNKKIVIPQRRIKESSKNAQFTGAYVKDPIVGMHNWIVSFDLDSLYPSLIQLFNISPETKKDFHAKQKFTVNDILNKKDNVKSLIDAGAKRNSCMSANGIFFDTTRQGFLSELMEKMYKERKMYKRKMIECKIRLKEEKDTLTHKEKEQLELDVVKYHNYQLVRKINLNSAFGTVGNQYFRHFDIDLAEAITLSGQLVIRWIERRLNVYLNKTLNTKDQDYIIASDTDSVYICLDQVVRKFMSSISHDKQLVTAKLNNFCNDIIVPFIQKQYDELKEYLNCPVQTLNMKREGIANKGVWTAKKRYMLNLFMGEDNVLLDDPDIKVMGIEVVRSSTPQPVRKALKECISLILNKDEDSLISYVENFKKEFFSMPVEDISFPRSCNDVNKYFDPVKIYKKSTPIAVKGALIYNNALKNKKLSKKYSTIKDGEKVKFVYLKEPNTVGARVVSFSVRLPEELGLHNSIDYEMQFQKSFVDPLKGITECINWNMERTSTLEQLFV